MGDRLTQGPLARGIDKLDARTVSARPRGPSALLATTRSLRTDVSCLRTAISSPLRPARQAGVDEQTYLRPQRRSRHTRCRFVSYGPAWPNLKQAVKGMKEIIELAKAGRLPPLGEPTTD